MNTKIRNLKGTKDFLPDEQIKREDIISNLKTLFRSYGYEPLETSNLCYYDLLASKYAGGAEILKEMYTLKDQGDRNIGLRYDLTIPFAKVIAMNPQITMPLKRYEIGKVFRDGPVKTGRVREFTQCDVDVVGIGSVQAEAELMKMASDFYKSMNLNFYIYYNNRKLLSGLVKASDIDNQLESSVILTLDKVEKIGLGGVESELIQKGIETSSIKKLFYWLNLDKNELLKTVKEKIPNDLVEQGLKELDELNSYLKAYNANNVCIFNPWLARGLEIYTGTVFEVFLKDSPITSSIGGGGRYDKIIGSFINNGKSYPAVGITFGLDVIYTALSLDGQIKVEPVTKLYVIPIGNNIEAIKITSKIRSMGIAVDIEMTERKLKKSLEYVNKKGIPYTIIIGEDELEKGVVKLKSMVTGNEIPIKIENLERDLIKYLAN